MQDRAYGRASAVVVDPVMLNRQATLASLYELGFRNVDSVADLTALETRWGERDYDLLITDVSSDTGAVCNFLQRLRRADIAGNPFAVVLAMAWRMSRALVQDIIDAGADDLLGRPCSIAQIGARVQSLVFARKPFVVTHGYVGPDRWEGPVTAHSAPRFDAPNTLRGQALASGYDGAGEIAAGRARLQHAILKSQAFQLALLSESYVQSLTGGPGFAVVPGGSEALLVVAGRVLELADALKLDTVTELVTSFRDLIVDAPPPGSALARERPLLLRELATAVDVALSPGKERQDITREIVATVHMLRERDRKRA